MRWCLVFSCCLLSLHLGAADFHGWQSMEVIKLDDARGRKAGPIRSSASIRIGDINGDGHENIIVVKRRQSLLVWYSYVLSDQRKTIASQNRPNALPLTPRFQEHEFRLERLPRDVIVLGPKRVAVLVGPPNRLEIYNIDDDGAWKKDQYISLLPGAPTPHIQMLHVPGQKSLYIQTDAGVQIISLEKELSVSWMRPRDDAIPWHWFLSDLDGDGDKDLVKVFGSAVETIVWHRNENGFRPPQSVHDNKVRDAVVLDRKNGASDIYMVDAIGDALLRRYRLQAGEEHRFGAQRALTLPGQKAPWAGVRLEDKNALVAYDTEHPQLLVFPFKDGDWTEATSFPCIDKVEAVIAPQAQPGVLLLKRKDDSELYKSEWSNGRFSFPQPWMHQEHKAEKVKLLNIGTAGDNVWWTQKQNKDIVLFVWPKSEKAPLQYRYTDKGEKVEVAKWLGGTTLLVKDTFKRDGKIYDIENEQVIERQCAHLKNINVKQYRAQINAEGKILPMRHSEGVLQWLDKNLHAVDQIMLDDGLRIDDYVVIGKEQFVLQADSMKLFQLKRDDSGVMRRDKQFEIPGGFDVHLDPVMGLFIQEPGWVCRLDAGKPWTLESIEHVDERQAQPKGLKETKYNRLFAVSVHGAEEGAFIVTDDRQHRLNLFKRDAKETQPLASWKVFEDTKYPYGGGRAAAEQREPRLVRSILFDNDKEPDLLLMCHDRLLVYLSQRD